MDFSQFVPRETHNALKWLGQTNWLQTSIDATGEIAYKWNFPPRDKSISEKDYEFISRIQETCTGNDMGRDYTNADRLLGLFYRAASKSLVLGPKMFQPTPIQCEALENVDIEVPFEDYRQPYETLIVKLPEEYRRAAMARYNLTAFPLFTICHHEMNTGIITVASNYTEGARADGRTVVAVLRPTRPGMTIEEEFQKKQLKNLPMVDRLIQRLGVNICLLMTHYRTRTRPADAEYLANLRKLAKKQNPQKAERARNLLVGQMTIVEFEQEINFHDEEVEAPENGDITEVRPGATGFAVRPHWRKGYYRRQTHGIPWLDRYTAGLIPNAVVIDETHHRVFLKPILVKKLFFGGDKSATSVTYKGDKRDMYRPPDKPRPI